MGGIEKLENIQAHLKSLGSKPDPWLRDEVWRHTTKPNNWKIFWQPKWLAAGVLAAGVCIYFKEYRSRQECSPFPLDLDSQSKSQKLKTRRLNCNRQTNLLW